MTTRPHQRQCPPARSIIKTIQITECASDHHIRRTATAYHVRSTSVLYGGFMSRSLLQSCAMEMYAKASPMKRRQNISSLIRAYMRPMEAYSPIPCSRIQAEQAERALTLRGTISIF